MLETEKARVWNAADLAHKHPHAEKLGPVFRLKNANHAKGREHQSSMAPPAATEIETTSLAADDKLLPTERRFAFMRQQHGEMLAALHKEISELKERNKDLQFQLVFADAAQSSEGAVREVTLLHGDRADLERVEGDLRQMWAELQESKARNACLSAIVEEQRAKLLHLEQVSVPVRDPAREQTRPTNTSSQTQQRRAERLEKVEILIGRLREENTLLKKQLLEIRDGSRLPLRGRSLPKGFHDDATLLRLRRSSLADFNRSTVVTADSGASRRRADAGEQSQFPPLPVSKAFRITSEFPRVENLVVTGSNLSPAKTNESHSLLPAIRKNSKFKHVFN